MKACNKCGEVYLINKENFSPSKSSSDGFTSKCKKCINEYNRAWKKKHKDRLQEKYGDKQKEYLKEYYKQNKEELNIKKKAYYQNNKEYFNKLSNEDYYAKQEFYKELRKQNYKDNRERELQNKIEYYKNNKLRIKQYNKLYRRDNKETIHISWSRRKYRELLLPSTFTVEQWENCKIHFNNECAYCGSKETLQQEHVIPVAKGGGYTQLNIVPSCFSCNTNKRAKNFGEWYKSYKHYDKDRESKILAYLSSIKKKKIKNEEECDL